jgi:ATP-binding cassette subfamily B protein
LFSVTPQDPALFDISLRENLCLGEIGVTDKDIVSILERLNMRDVIDRLANGLETRVGPRGGKLSIGERQRIGVARALLRPAPIMLFDEPTAALDVETEQKVVDEMSTRLATRAKIVITHRKAALRDAARIIVMEDGCVAQVGSHQELLDNCEFYRALWNS